MKTIVAVAILVIVAATGAESAARKPDGHHRQAFRACGKLPYASFLQCRDYFLKLGYGIQVTAPFCQYHCSR